MDATIGSRSYGQRDADPPGPAGWDAKLPLRILSSDALCAIDVSHTAHSLSDTITPSLLREYARNLIAVCVEGTPSLGGVYTNLGDHGGLALRVTSYRPKVHCFGEGTGPPWYSCRDIIDSMPVGEKRVRFGPEGDALADVVVPWRYTTRERRCAITVDTVSEPDVSDFYKLWAAVSAVDTLCVLKGKAGMAIGNGLMGNLVVGLKDLELEPGMGMGMGNSSTVSGGLEGGGGGGAVM